MTAAVQYSEPLRSLTGWFFGEEGRKLNPAIDKLPADQQAKLADIFGRMMAQQESAKFWIGAPKPDEPLLASAVHDREGRRHEEVFRPDRRVGQASVGSR